MIRTIVCSLLLLTFHFLTQAQENFQEGYILTPTNDTISGFLSIQDENQSAASCWFKKSKSDIAQVYKPDQLIGFGQLKQNKLYLSKSIKIKNVVQPFFMDCLFKGDISLYYFINSKDSTKYYVFEVENGETVHLSQSVEEQKISQTDRSWLGTRNKNVLSYLFRDYEPLKESIDMARFDRKDLIDLICEYHLLTKNKGRSYENEPMDELKRAIVSAYCGLDYTNIPNTYIHLPIFEKLPAISPMVGAVLQLSNPKWSKNFRFVVDFSMTNIHTNKVDLMHYGRLVQKEENYLVTKQTVDYSTYRFLNKIGFKIAFQRGNLEPCFEFGSAGEYFFNEKERLQYTYSNVETSDEMKKERIYSEPDRPNNLLFTGMYTSLGLDYKLRNKHYLTFRICETFLKQMNALQTTVGYTF